MTCQFSEKYISRDRSGGMDCLRSLSESIYSALLGTATKGCKCVVRIYADFTKLIGQYPPGSRDPRDRLSILRSFAAGLNTMDNSVDFVDAGSQPNMVFNKIKGMSAIRARDCC